jgi:transposase
MNFKEIEEILGRAKIVLNPDDFEKISAVLKTLSYLTGLVGDRNTTIARLRQIIFGASTEKLSNLLKTVLPTADNAATDSNGASAPNTVGKSPKSSPPAKGHGKNAATQYNGAAKVKVKHTSLKYGQCCPSCLKGKLYDSVEPGILVRIVGQAPLGATVYELEKLRCNLCSEIFTATPPPGVRTEKYDASSGSMIALLKYGNGVPFYRIAGLQNNMGIPLPASTQWDIVENVAKVVEPAFNELVHQAAQGSVLYNDDTTMKVLELSKDYTKAPDEDLPSDSDDDAASKRCGVFTTGIVSTTEQHKIALFFTGHKHAGENLSDLLKERAEHLPTPIQMCDALSRNAPKELKTILANCNCHGRRNFVDQALNFPVEALFVLEIFEPVFKYDAEARQQKLSPEERLAFHQANSGPLMQKLLDWMNEQFSSKKVEPNSGLGQAIKYMLKHWEKLTLFLRVAGAPLDNNICERALKKAILHRKNALFYKTQHGANVGDLFMSLIYSCQLCAANSFDYLTQLQIHHRDLILNPADWMPWNYRQTLDRLPANQSTAPPA